MPQHSSSEASHKRLRIGDYTVDPDASTISLTAGGRVRHVPPQAMATLLCLADRPGEVVARESILERWPADCERSDDALTHAIHLLREAFSDDARRSRYIKTSKHRGYSLIPRLAFDGPTHTSGTDSDHKRLLYRVAVLYWSAASIVMQGVTFLFELDRTQKGYLIGSAIVCFLLTLALVSWLQRNIDLPNILEWLLKLIPTSAVGLTVAALVASGLVFFVLRSLTAEPPEPEEPVQETRRPPALSEAARLSVAVLPFLYEGSEQTYAYLADGLPDELIAVLSRLQSIQVVSRTASFPLVNVALDQIAERLQVAHIIEGRVGTEKDQLRLTVKLVDTVSGRAVWSHKYEQTLGSGFGVYDSIVFPLAEAVVRELGLDAEPALEQMKPADQEAYSWYLQGRSLLLRPSDGTALDEAERLFRRILDHDPTFARAYAGLGHANLARYRSTRDNVFIAPAAAACNRALELDAGAEEVQVALVKLYTETRDFAAADREVDLALSSDPNSYEALLSLSELRWAEERLEEARAAYLRAIDLQPGNWRAYSGYGAFLFTVDADYACAERQYKKVVSLTPDSTIALANLGAVYMYEGRLEEALSTYEAARKLEPNGATLSNLGLVYYYLGRYADALGTLSEAARLAPSDHRIRGNLALAQTYAGSSDTETKQTYAIAIDLAKRRLMVDAEDADALADLASYHAANGSSTQAEERIAEATKLLPNDGTIRYLGAVVHELLGQRDAALQATRDALVAGFPARFVEGDARLRNIVNSPEYLAIMNDLKNHPAQDASQHTACAPLEKPDA